jgi:hypothetical protein
LKGATNLPSRTQRQTVAGLTGNMPGFFGVLANSLMRITLLPISPPAAPN